MKKLISIISSVSLIGISSITTISCSSNSYSLSLQQKETIVINAINEYENINNSSLDLKISDIYKVNNLKYTDNTFTYDLLLLNYSKSKNIISSQYQYLNPEVEGSFKFKNKQIQNNNLKVTENIDTNYDIFLHRSDLLLGKTNDFTAIFCYSEWRNITYRIQDASKKEQKGKHTKEVTKYINNELNLKNKDIILTTSDWINIDNDLLQKYHTRSIKSGYSILLHVVNKKLVFSNINPDGTTNMPYADNFERIINNISEWDKDTYQFILSKPLLLELKDMFDYNNNLWNDSEIQNLIDNKIWLTNCNIQDALTILKLLFDNNNLSTLNKLLSENRYEFFDINMNKGIASVEYWRKHKS